MLSTNLEPDKSNLGEYLRGHFVGTTTWPLRRASLTAIVDLGLSDDCIAKYFKVLPSEVRTLRHAYGVEAPTSMFTDSFKLADHPCAGPHPTD